MCSLPWVQNWPRWKEICHTYSQKETDEGVKGTAWERRIFSPDHHCILCHSANRGCSPWTSYRGRSCRIFTKDEWESGDQNIWNCCDGITHIPQVRSFLRHYVMHDLCKDNPPNPNDRAYLPLDNDLRNHIYMAKRAIQLSCLDQENAMLKIEQWRKTEPDSTHFFRPFIEVNTEECPRETAPPPENSNTEHETGSYKQQLLWVHQTNWQKQVLVRYGNVISFTVKNFGSFQPVYKVVWVAHIYVGVMLKFHWEIRWANYT